MKTILPLLLLSVLVSSCRKERCWTCSKDTLDRHYNPGETKPYQEGRLHEPLTVCEKTEDEIRAYEDESFVYRKDSISEFRITMKCQ